MVKQKSEELVQFLAAHDYPNAIESALFLKEHLNGLKQFSAVRQMNGRLQDGFSVVQQKLDETMIDVCRQFDQETYRRAMRAYRLLGNSVMVDEKLQHFYTDSINNNVRSCLIRQI